jgi:hypothetical protein
MLIEVWERLRGYDKWTPAVATVQSSTLAGVGFGNAGKKGGGKELVFGWQSVCRIVWQDHHCIQRSAAFEASEGSPLYQLREGDTVDIRFNPDRPAEFYLPGLLKSNLAGAWELGLCAVGVILVFIALVVAWFGPIIPEVFSH